MIQPDRDGMVPCPCGAPRHFARPCARCAGPSPALLPHPALAVGGHDTPAAREAADHARTAASGRRTGRTPHVAGWEGGS